MNKPKAKAVATDLKFRVTIASPDGETKTLEPTACFDWSPDTYGNGYYMVLNNAGLGWQNVYDCRYDKRLDPKRLREYVRMTFKEIWSGERGAWKVVKIEDVEEG